MVNHTFSSDEYRRFDPVAAYDRDAAPRQFDSFWSIAGVLFITGATAILADEQWPADLVAASDTAESTATAAILAPPRFNVIALTADFEVAPLTADDIRHVQARLEELGFAPGRIDGIAGGRTLDALNAYRASRNLEPASLVDYGSAGGLLD